MNPMTAVAFCLCLLNPTPIIDRGDLMGRSPTMEDAGEWLDPRPVEEWKDDENDE